MMISLTAQESLPALTLDFVKHPMRMHLLNPTSITMIKTKEERIT